MLKASDPQNKMRSGSVDFVDTCRRGRNFLKFPLARNDRMGWLGSSCCMTRDCPQAPCVPKIEVGAQSLNKVRLSALAGRSQAYPISLLDNALTNSFCFQKRKRKSGKINQCEHNFVDKASK